MKAQNITREIMTGNEAVATGVKLARVKFISAYPITPQTAIVEKLAEMVANNKINAKFIEVESEHSAMASTMTSEITGIRSFTASSSHGILYMHEMLHWVAGSRLPVLMAVVNRAIGPPWNIWADQTDSITQRDTGWMQVYCESNQEAMYSILLGYKVAENKNVMLPIMSMQDAFTLSHTSEPVIIRDESDAYDYIGDLNLPFSIDLKNPLGYGSLMPPDGPFMELKKDMRDSMYRALDVVKEETKKFNDKFNADFPGLIENFMMEDADYALITMGSMSSTGKYTVRKLREKGMKVGLIRILFYRPFPAEEILKSIRGLKGLGVLDRSITFGQRGAVYEDVVTSLYNKTDIPIKNYIIGLGGRDIRVKDYERMYEGLMEGGDSMEWINVGGK
jgi:2-oxoisovalerate ferredoxin oxidoreductase alpha subunit